MTGALGQFGETSIDESRRDLRAAAELRAESGDWSAISTWAQNVADELAREQPAEHVAVFVPDPSAGGLRLVAQVWGAGEDTGEVVVGEWVVPFEGSVTGRVHRTGGAALVADVSMDPDYRPFPGGRTRSSLTVPVGPRGAVVAVINVEAPWVGAFAIRDYERLVNRAEQALQTFPRPAPD
jgi:hypothetical protein